MTVGGMTPLMYAVESGEVETVATCLNSSCNPFAQNGFGETAKDLANKFSATQGGHSIVGLIEEAIE